MRKNGFSLIELMISAAILVAVILPVFMFFYYYLVAMETSRNTTIAVSDAAFIIESMRMRGTDPFTIDDMVIAYPNGVDRADSIGPQKLKDETVRVFYADPSADLLEVTVRVDWKDEIRVRSRWLSIDTMMTQR